MSGFTGSAGIILTLLSLVAYSYSRVVKPLLLNTMTSQTFIHRALID